MAFEYTGLSGKMQGESFTVIRKAHRMATTGLLGPYSLTDDAIDTHVSSQKIGAYALGSTGQDGTFYISYVGRSDTDLNKRLHQHVGDFSQFKYGYFPNAKAAYEKECQLYHDFPNQNNKVHPKKPEGTNYTCPVCGA